MRKLNRSNTEVMLLGVCGVFCFMFVVVTGVGGKAEESGRWAFGGAALLIGGVVMLIIGFIVGAVMRIVDATLPEQDPKDEKSEKAESENKE